MFATWRTRDLEARAALYVVLADDDVERVEPPPADHQIFDFLCDFYLDCVVNDDERVDDLEYTPNATIAATECQAWCLQWPNEGFNGACLEFEKRLRERFLANKSNTRVASQVAHLLMYLLVDARFRQVFQGWLNDPDLRPIAKTALDNPLVYAELIESNDVPRPQRE
ncbi:MAG: hypothetical protein AAFV36_07145 [Myxococcota bacterium]